MTVTISQSDQQIIDSALREINEIPHSEMDEIAFANEVRGLPSVQKVTPGGSSSSGGIHFTIVIQNPEGGAIATRRITKKFKE